MIAALALATAVTAARAAEVNADVVLEGWLRAQRELKTWSADFVQTRTLKALSQPLVSTGHVRFAAPDRFRWELGQPAQTIAVRNAEHLLVYYPRLERAERYPLAGAQAGPLGEMLGLLDAGFPRGRAEFLARFRLVSVTATNGVWTLELEPVRSAARRLLPQLHVSLATNAFELAATEVVFPDGSRMRSAFTNAVANAPLDGAWFALEFGPDTRVSEPLTP